MANEKRLIDLDKLVAHFRATKIDEVFPNWKELFPSTQAAIIRLTTKYRAIVLNAPIVDAVHVVHGRWIESTNTDYMMSQFTCSECGVKYIAKTWNYCPNCGAKMDGDGNGT